MFKEKEQKSSSEKYPLEYCPILPNERMVWAAKWVADQTAISKTMLPKTELEVCELFAAGHSVLILDQDKKPIAHGAITYIYPGQVLEIGAIVVDPVKRRQGWGTLVAEYVSQLASLQYNGYLKFALCNQYSLPIFQKLGGVAMDQSTEPLIPQEVWEACANCPSLQQTKTLGKKCCDTLIILP